MRAVSHIDVATGPGGDDDDDDGGGGDDDDDDDDGTAGGNPPPHGDVAGGNPPPDTAMDNGIGGTRQSAVLALFFLSGLLTVAGSSVRPGSASALTAQDAFEAPGSSPGPFHLGVAGAARIAGRGIRRRWTALPRASSVRGLAR